jgi:hypothetical protein
MQNADQDQAAVSQDSEFSESTLER